MSNLLIDLENLPAVTNKVYMPIYKNDSRYLVLYGGAGSGKSFFAAEKLIFRIITEQNHRFLIVRKIGRTLRDSVFFLMREAITMYGLQNHCVINKTDMTISFPLFKSEMIFKSIDDPEKLKSITNITGVWIEEASELGDEDFRQVDLRLRGKTQNYKQIVLTFNPITSTHWLKKEFFDSVHSASTTILKTTYKDNRFLDEEYINVLEKLKEQDYYYYTVYCLGEWGALGNLILTNWSVGDISRKPEDYDTALLGLDFGFNHPSALLEVGYKDGELFIFNEIYERELSNNELIEVVKNNRISNSIIIGDSSEPARIKEFNNAGVRVIPAVKGPDSVKAGIDWLRRHKIHVHPSCSNTIKELQGWKYREDKDGNILDEPVPINDDAMAALRYATENLRRSRQLKATRGLY